MSLLRCVGTSKSANLDWLALCSHDGGTRLAEGSTAFDAADQGSHASVLNFHFIQLNGPLSCEPMYMLHVCLDSITSARHRLVQLRLLSTLTSSGIHYIFRDIPDIRLDGPNVFPLMNYGFDRLPLGSLYTLGQRNRNWTNCKAGVDFPTGRGLALDGEVDLSWNFSRRNANLYPN